jgi:hypothetical protein
MPKEQIKTLRIKAKAKPATRVKSTKEVKELATKNPINPKAKQLTREQELFCQYYVTQEFFANGLKSYAEAYGMDTSDPTSYRSAKESASRLLRNVDICQRINELLDMQGLSDQFVDKQMAFLITQNDDFSTKLQAMKMYNDMHNRIKSRLEVTGKDGGAIQVNYQLEKLDQSQLKTLHTLLAKAS